MLTAVCSNSLLLSFSKKKEKKKTKIHLKILNGFLPLEKYTPIGTKKISFNAPSMGRQHIFCLDCNTKKFCAKYFGNIFQFSKHGRIYPKLAQTYVEIAPRRRQHAIFFDN